MKFVFTLALALVLLSVESVVVRYLGLSVSRIDVTVAVVAFLAMRASTLEGAISSFSVGYLLDLMSGRPTGLYTFLAVLLFLVGRMVASAVEIRSAAGFVAFAVAADFGHGLLAVVLTWLTSGGEAVGTSLRGLPVQALLTGVAALCMYPLLSRFESNADRPQVGLLR